MSFLDDVRSWADTITGTVNPLIEDAGSVYSAWRQTWGNTDQYNRSSRYDAPTVPTDYSQWIKIGIYLLIAFLAVQIIKPIFYRR